MTLAKIDCAAIRRERRIDSGEVIRGGRLEQAECGGSDLKLYGALTVSGQAQSASHERRDYKNVLTHGVHSGYPLIARLKRAVYLQFGSIWLPRAAMCSRFVTAG